MGNLFTPRSILALQLTAFLAGLPVGASAEGGTRITVIPDTSGNTNYHRELECSGEELASPEACVLSYGTIGFTLRATDNSSLNHLVITPGGLTIDNREIKVELDGTAYRAELADIDGNGWPEIYIYVSAAGSGSYGSLVAYAVNRGKSMSSIYLPPMEQSPDIASGYMGHDEFAVVENRLVRRFPLYRDTDVNASATGGTRQIHYRLEPGEAGWLLKVDRIANY